MEQCSCSVDLAEQSLIEIQQYLALTSEFKFNEFKDIESTFPNAVLVEIKILITQVCMYYYLDI